MPGCQDHPVGPQRRPELQTKSPCALSPLRLSTRMATRITWSDETANRLGGPHPHVTVLSLQTPAHVSATFVASLELCTAL